MVRQSRRGFFGAVIGLAVGILIPIPKPKPAVLSIPFATLPTNIYIRGPRYRVDVRRILCDNPIKDTLSKEDLKFIRAVMKSSLESIEEQNDGR